MWVMTRASARFTAYLHEGAGVFLRVLAGVSRSGVNAARRVKTFLGGYKRLTIGVIFQDSAGLFC